MNGTVTLLCGRIGSGKSTYAKQIAPQLKAVILCVDEISLSLFPMYDPEHEAHSAAIRALLLEKAVETAHNGANVILDWGFLSRSDREAALAHFAARQIPARMIWLNVPEAELARRRAMRNAERPKYTYLIDKGLAAKCDSLFETPGADEDCIRIDF